jgi:protein-disulfide isomerase-like protein with CxxC motif
VRLQQASLHFPNLIREETKMDLRAYYKKIREVEEKILEEFVVVVSQATADGGKLGTFTEVVRRVAAKLIVDGLARLATHEETKTFQAKQAEQRRVADQLAAASKVQFAVLSTDELTQLKTPAKPTQRIS